MSEIRFHLLLISLLGLILTNGGCENDPEGEELKLPELSTAIVTEISDSSAISGGTILSTGAMEITDKGICWSTNTGPTIHDVVISAGAGSGSFISTIKDLQPQTYYYVRAFATNSDGTGYGEERSFRTKTMNSTVVQDVDGNAYPTVKIGDQVWMAKNLKATKFRSGARITNVTDNDQWSNLSTPAYSYYNNVSGNGYGLLYNGLTIMTDEVCPEGWHLPALSEWAALIDTIGGKEVAGGKLKESGIFHWSAPNVGATDEFGFTALPGGLRYTDGSFKNQGDVGYWWAAPDSSTQLVGIIMSYNTENVNFGGSPENIAESVRCIKDSIAIKASDP